MEDLLKLQINGVAQQHVDNTGVGGNKHRAGVRTMKIAESLHPVR